MTFSQLNLDQNIHKAIHICGYTNPTPVQSRCIPNILEGKDLVASAQTGTGKTAAFVLPALQRLSAKNKQRKPRVLILTPTRELASQITQAANKYGKFIRFNMASLVGGMPYRQQLRDLARDVDMVVATPGRLLDHVENGRLDLSGIEMLILDEADRMLDMGFIDDVQMIAKETPTNRQTLLFSATVDDKLAHIVRNLLSNPVRIDLSTQVVSPTLIKQEIYMADNLHHKNKLLQHFLDNGNMFKAIIFTATKIAADQLAGDLRDQGFAAAALHGDLKQSMRNRTVDQLRRGKIQLVVATDVAARGIDISDLTHVINYDLPRFCEDYVHRIGRTGRAGKEGVAISFVMPADMRHLQRIEKYMGQKLPKQVIAGLEPRKQSFAVTSEPTKKKKFGKSRDRFAKENGKHFGDSKQRVTKENGKRFGDSKKRVGGENSKRFDDSKKRAANESGKRFGDSKKRVADENGKRFDDSKKRVANENGKRFGDSKKRVGDENSKRYDDNKKRRAEESGKRFFNERKEKSSYESKKRFDGGKFSNSKPSRVKRKEW